MPSRSDDSTPDESRLQAALSADDVFRDLTEAELAELGEMEAIDETNDDVLADFTEAELAAMDDLEDRRNGLEPTETVCGGITVDLPICQNPTEIDRSVTLRTAHANLPICQKTGSRIDKSVNETRPFSRVRDAKVVRILKELFEQRPELIFGIPPLVGDSPDSLTLASLASELATPLTLPDLIDSSGPLWWKEELPTPRKFRRPAPWRDISDHLQLLYWHLGLRSLGPVHNFTLNLRDDVELQALAQADALDWLASRIKRQLQKALGRDVDLYAVIEDRTEDDEKTGASGRRRLHVHGEFGIGPKEAVAARRALRIAGGEWEGEKRQFQAQTRPEPDSGWSSYLGKQLVFHQAAKLRLDKVRFLGEPLLATRLLSSRAKQIYEHHRALLHAEFGKSPLAMKSISKR